MAAEPESITRAHESRSPISDPGVIVAVMFSADKTVEVKNVLSSTNKATPTMITMNAVI
jgi:hypothetical protein